MVTYVIGKFKGKEVWEIIIMNCQVNTKVLNSSVHNIYQP